MNKICYYNNNKIKKYNKLIINYKILKKVLQWNN